MKHIVIETERLTITPQSIAEIEALRDKESDPEMKKAYSEMLNLMLGLNGSEEWGSDWKISLKSGEAIGGIGFKGLPDADGIVEIGYGIDEAYRQQGYATEAVGGMVKWVRKENGVKYITAQTDPHNKISQKVLLANGFFRDGNGEEGPLFKIRNIDLE